jgi:hypothetical protein
MTTKKPEKETVRIELTEQQKETLRELGVDAPYDKIFADLKIEELEERICPAMMTN